MKNSRMIVKTVIVLAIVGSAFAFTAKRFGSFCKSTTDQANQNCAVVQDLMISVGVVNTFYKANWNGSTATCIPNDCPVPVRLIIE